MMNERITENIVRQHFSSYGSAVQLEEQRSESRRIQRLLQTASKSGTGQIGKPEFIVRFDDAPDLVVVVECKADKLRHRSADMDDPQRYAVDGALHYASHLSKEFDALAIGVSGTTDPLVSHFLHLKGEDSAAQIFGERLLSPSDYIRGYYGDPGKYRQDYDSLVRFMRNLNTRLHSYKVSESHRAVLLSAILIALDRQAFASAYSSENNPTVLARSVVESAMAQLLEAGVSGFRLEPVRREFEFLLTSPILSKKPHVLREIIHETEREVNSFIKNHKYRDVLGSLFVEFLRYANSEKGLGIVLTPPHITEFFADIAQVNPKSVVYDNCAGTGGFLISAMRKMVDQAKGDTALETNIKKEQIYGVEMQSNIFSLAVSNMYIHQDGKSNMEFGDCFDPTIMENMRARRPTVGFLNPPYKANKATDTEELSFVANNLNCLTQGAACAAIVPMQSALSTNRRIASLKSELLKKHTLEAVLSMPDELFFNSNVNVVSCVMVFTAHRPHPEQKEVFLGYCKDDGFVKRRIGGRCDALERWDAIREEWLRLYFNRIAKPGSSVCVRVDGDSEWAAEAYIETDLNALTPDVFEAALHEYASYLFSNGRLRAASDKAASEEKPMELFERKWALIPLQNLFDIKGTKTTPFRELQYFEGEKRYPYVKTAATNNGVGGEFAHWTERGGVLTVDSAVKGYCSYQRWNFSASDHVEKLIPRFNMDIALAMFLATVINQEQYRYSYGRKCSQTRLRKASVALPVLPDTDDAPDFDFMREYIARLRYSDNCIRLENAERASEANPA